jgi:hypothetical protein
MPVSGAPSIRPSGQRVPFYEALADKLPAYSNRRDDLFALMKDVASNRPDDGTGFIVRKFDAMKLFGKALELLALSARRGIGKIITARNCVGLITMSDGTVIEILPKIVGNSITVEDTKHIFPMKTDMLKIK